MKANTALSVLFITQLGVPGVTFAQTPAAAPANKPAPAPVNKPAAAAAKTTPETAVAQEAPAASSTAKPASQGAQAPTPATPSADAAGVPAAQPEGAEPARLPALTQPTSNVGAAASAAPEAPAASADLGTGDSATPSTPSGAVAGPHGIAVTATESAAAKRPRKSHYPLSLQLDLIPVWHTSNGFDLFSDRDVSTRVGLSAGYDVVQITPKTLLGVELGWSTESLNDDPLSGALSTAFSAHNFHGGIKARHQLLPFLAPYVNALGGASRMETTFDVPSAGKTFAFETVKWVPFGMFGAGVAAMLPVENVVSFGIAVEGGYVISGAMPLRLDPERASGTLQVSGADLGSLGRSGPYLRIGFFLRY